MTILTFQMTFSIKKDYKKQLACCCHGASEVTLIQEITFWNSILEFYNRPHPSSLGDQTELIVSISAVQVRVQQCFLYTEFKCVFADAATQSGLENWKLLPHLFCFFKSYDEKR